jgi:hypothetical protein
MATIEQVFGQIREASRQNEDILGFVLTGSRGKGFENEWSDYDFAIFVTDESLEKYQHEYRVLPPGGRLYIFTLDSFKARAAWGGTRQWERYTWAHLTVENDRSGGEIKKLLDEKARVPADHAEAHIRHSLRWFLNQVHHAIKNHRAGNAVGHRLEAVEAIRPFLSAVFCAHDRRLVPYYKYLQWELETFPLTQLSLSAGELLACFIRIMEKGDVPALQTLLKEAKWLFSAEEFAFLFELPMARSGLAYRPGNGSHEAGGSPLTPAGS